MRDITRQMRLQEWAAQVEDWKRSGLTQRQWAKVHGILAFWLVNDYLGSNPFSEVVDDKRCIHFLKDAFCFF